MPKLGRWAGWILGALLWASQPARADTVLKIGMAAADLGTADPHRAVALQDMVTIPWMYNALVRFPPGSADPTKLEPDLAISWEVSADGLRWTFHLRPGVRFSDGAAFDSADVAASLRRASDPRRSSFAADYAAIDGIDTPDPATAIIRLKQPTPGLLTVLANYHGGFIVERNADTMGGLQTRSAGTGPFVLANYAKTQGLTFAANPAYFRGKPAIDELQYLYILSDANRDLAYSSGEIDLIYGRQDQTWMDRTKQVPGTVIDKVGPNVLGLLHLNLSQPPLDDLRVRQAIAYAIDRAKIVTFKGRDLSTVPVSVVPADYAGADRQAPLLPYDPARARELLRQAGQEGTLRIHMIQNPAPISLGPAQVLQAQLKQVGIALDLEVVDQSTWQMNIRKDLSQAINYSASRLPVALPYLD